MLVMAAMKKVLAAGNPSVIFSSIASFFVTFHIMSSLDKTVICTKQAWA